ncbi:hypothetical protein CCR83_07325 [Rhodobacter veldkampii DSM 11550]|uniref:Uncharacterized protein n=1 Tax=Phaeovulum veldkampii DSM 11550 TaxID=1185920 RepID=A0A2T4JD30_9RHOB|nr:hypothetical protein [Phaeovulum veldkampii]MBK5946256.1 hypothetical protein [Phaeovulum veldkampii DSM 11550]PTE15799.1 hypothetical protein C5F46_13585 [Phaeovulum veldkampii DSM 11550]TDQ54516.1 hypothetical protein EV658_1343 [Phaeovulum veldkampii DSM 11550]
MKIFPNAKVQTLKDCHPGQLVRGYGYSEDSDFGIVFDFDNGDIKKRGVISLTKNGPEYSFDEEPDIAKVLAYGGELVFEVNQLQHCESRASSLYDQKGVLVGTAAGWSLNVQAEEQFGRRGRRAQLHLPSAILSFGQDQAQGVGFFGSWSVYLEDEDRPVERRVLIAKFTVKGEV